MRMRTSRNFVKYLLSESKRFLVQVLIQIHSFPNHWYSGVHSVIGGRMQGESYGAQASHQRRHSKGIQVPRTAISILDSCNIGKNIKKLSNTTCHTSALITCYRVRAQGPSRSNWCAVSAAALLALLMVDGVIGCLALPPHSLCSRPTDALSFAFQLGVAQ